MSDFFNDGVLDGFDAGAFSNRAPFPWQAFEHVLRPERFAALLETFPSVALFDAHRGIERADHQRPHDRYYLAFERNIYRGETATPGVYGRDAGDSEMAPGDAPPPANALQNAGTSQPERRPGVVDLPDLPEPWQAFIEEIRASQCYQAFVERAFGAQAMTVRFAWHVGFEGSEVSPHRDTDKKLGTHIFYFNTSEDWSPEWGGSILVLGDKKVKQKNPDIADFGTVTDVDIRDNRSFLFKNTAEAWHGVEALRCPPQRYRRLFNVIFERVGPRPRRTLFQRLTGQR